MIVHNDGKLEGTPEELVEFLRLKEKTQSIFGLGALDWLQKTKPNVSCPDIYVSTGIPPKITYDNKTKPNALVCFPSDYDACMKLLGGDSHG